MILQGNNWDNFICLLCNCFELALCNAFAHSIQPSMSGADHSRSILWDFGFLKSRLHNSSWNCMAGILGILRGITKSLKGEYHEELVGVLLNSLSNFLLKVPWDLLRGAYKSGSEGCRTCPGEHALLVTNAQEPEMKILFLGHLIQLLCSLVGLTGSLEAGSTQSKFTILDNVCDLLPRLLHWCLGEEWGQHKHIGPYFQHKTLMLMIRLSFQMQLDCLTLVHWLQLIREYYQDLLSRPVSELECNQDDTLEDSPFLLSLSVQDVHHLSLCHLQRQAVFLLIRCSLTLSDLWLRKSTADLNCDCMRPNSSFACELNAIEDCCAEKKGLLEFYGWLRGQVSNIFAEDEMYQEKCIKFASSFIRLYKNEDDVLFEVLLQLFAIPLCGERMSLKERMACEDAEDLFHLSSLFNPVLLFHVFLAELQYDHQLLLDYLISRDTGSKCAEYLLRCLRAVCDSWKLFVEFPVTGRQESCLTSCKRRKVFHRDFCKSCSANPLEGQLALSSEQLQEEQELTGNFFASRGPQFEDAKACLLSLKSSLRKLHERKLFPYNPEVLIRREMGHPKSVACDVLEKAHGQWFKVQRRNVSNGLLGRMSHQPIEVYPITQALSWNSLLVGAWEGRGGNK
ncbi:hypothetical protein Cgig2_002799 [Carnegiea gigantea]|uniref:Protein Lines C-terminal domain-containing protein n=1 Tax=Carnegiea gigantea TaxID=171969 RepID=A0A9Q1QLF4_9CARY|nr:hypothetical protein Cgig2_002799 [Carnegiea gigantea]